jgi:Virulence factor SrfB
MTEGLSDPEEIFELECMPDTGHCYAFIPLFDVSGEKLLDGLPDGADFGSLIQHAAGDGWSSHVGRPWMTSRLLRRFMSIGHGQTREVVGIALAIETNLGGVERGYVFTDRKVQGEERTGRLKRPPPPVPYAALSGKDVDHGRPSDIRLLSEIPRLRELVGDWDGLILRIHWLLPGGDPIEVDVIVDFGNTRTSVLLLENIAASQQVLRDICHPLVFSEAIDFDDETVADGKLTELLPESWFILREPPFQDERGQPFQFERDVRVTVQRGLWRRTQDEIDKVEDVVPDMFRQLSPALMGVDARPVLAASRSTGGGLLFMSSPKRYAWDMDPTATGGATFWIMEPSRWRYANGARPRNLTPLRCEVLRFVTRDLTVWNEPPFASESHRASVHNTDRPDHPRAAGLVWAALAIMEAAYRQMNSRMNRARDRGHFQRTMRRVILACPPGWTAGEIDAFHKAWRLARQVFFFSRDMANEPADVHLGLDEAVAAQMPFIFSETRHLGDNGGRMMAIYGRPRGGQRTLRAMTIDIGGGTTDTAIVEYQSLGVAGQPHLTYQYIFRDSTTVAGDLLVKRIIEEVLLPALVRNKNDAAARDGLRNFFLARDRANGPRKSLSTRLILVPMVMRWLTDLAEETEGTAEAKAWGPNNLGIDPEKLEEFNEALRREGLQDCTIPYGEPFTVDYDDIRAVMADWLRPIVAAHARSVAAFGCDLVIITGKPSEQKLVRDMFVFGLPILPNRVLSARGYYTGNWAPLGPDGKIHDAKLVTSLGAALFRAVTSRHIGNWTIERSKTPREPQRNYWGPVTPQVQRFDDAEPDACYLLAPQDEVTREMAIDTFIGRALFLRHSRAEQVYRLRWRGAGEPPARRVRVTLRRSRYQPRDSDFEVAEGLELVRAELLVTTGAVRTDQMELQLCTLQAGQGYWLDTGEFDIRFKS